MSSTISKNLDLDRIFNTPDINGPAPINLRFSPNGQHVTFLKSSKDNFEQLDLWQYDIASKTESLLVASSQLMNSERLLSDEEKARRERKRIFHSGIVEYFWSPSGEHLVFPLDGNLYLYSPSKPDEQITRLTDDATFETDIRFSPNGEFLSFVRDKNLFIIKLVNREETQLTFDGGDCISNGLAEFIAQEEMHRFNGYWWSPDSQHIAFTQVDESPIPVSQRIEIDADSFGVFNQRYPYAGDNNAAVKVGTIEVTSHQITWAELPRAAESYLTRINWLPDSNRLAVQIQHRDQQKMQLIFWDRQDNQAKLILTETSDTWLNLHDDFRALPNNQFVWGSERSGFHHLYLYNDDGSLVQALSSGNWVVSGLKTVSQDAVYFEGFKDSVLEQHLYRVDLLAPGEPHRLTQKGHTHSTQISHNKSHFIDRYSSALSPPAVELRSIDGEMSCVLEANTLDADHAYGPYQSSRGKVTFGELEAEDGQSLHYRLIEPSARQDGRRYPVIVTVYGGPGVQRVSNEWIPVWHHYMAAQGYGLLQLDNRGSSNRGKAFEAPIYKQLGVCEVSDQLKGVAFLHSLNWVDADRIGVFGHSYGGYMTLMLMMKSKLFKAGISVAPVTDWKLYDTHYTERFLGHPKENTTGYTASNVFPYVQDLSGKLLVIHGMADDNVLFTNATKLFKALQEHNILFDSMNYPGAKHGLAGRKTNLHRYATMDKFLSDKLC